MTQNVVSILYQNVIDQSIANQNLIRPPFFAVFISFISARRTLICAVGTIDILVLKYICMYESEKRLKASLRIRSS